MDMEQLKMVLETIQQLGMQGKEAFIWWLVLDKALPVLGWMIFMCFLLVVIYWTIRAIMNHNDYYTAITQIREVLCLPRRWQYDDDDLDSMIAKLKARLTPPSK